MSYNIAIASANGQTVNQHFGLAKNFLIYRISDAGVAFVEDRLITGVLPSEHHHSEERLVAIANQLQDCALLFVSKIGVQASRYLYDHDIKSFEVNFSLHKVLSLLLETEKKGRINVTKL
jgi:predicted Fe-Mo cluster-binding NifX family protein